MKYLSIIFLLLFTLLACNKEEEKDTCSNGFVDIGETGVDCGGVCPPCPINIFPSVASKFNGAYTSFSTFSFVEDSDIWFLKYQNDTIDVQIRVGDNLFQDSLYTVPSTNSYVLINGINYNGVANPNLNQPSSTIGISDLDIANQRVTGLFNVIFFRPGTNDTLRVTAGAFSDVSF